MDLAAAVGDEVFVRVQLQPGEVPLQALEPARCTALKAAGASCQPDDYLVHHRFVNQSNLAGETVSPSRPIRSRGEGASLDEACARAIEDACTQLGDVAGCKPWTFRVSRINGEPLAGFRTTFDAVQDSGQSPPAGPTSCAIRWVSPEGVAKRVEGSGATLAEACGAASLAACAPDGCRRWSLVDLVSGIPFRALPHDGDLF